MRTNSAIAFRCSHNVTVVTLHEMFRSPLMYLAGSDFNIFLRRHVSYHVDELRPDATAGKYGPPCIPRVALHNFWNLKPHSLLFLWYVVRNNRSRGFRRSLGARRTLPRRCLHVGIWINGNSWFACHVSSPSSAMKFVSCHILRLPLPR